MGDTSLAIFARSPPRSRAASFFMISRTTPRSSSSVMPIFRQIVVFTSPCRSIVSTSSCLSGNTGGLLTSRGKSIMGERGLVCFRLVKAPPPFPARSYGRNSPYDKCAYLRFFTRRVACSACLATTKSRMSSASEPDPIEITVLLTYCSLWQESVPCRIWWV